MIRVQEGDSDALAMLFGRYARLVRVVSIRILRDEAEADDLVQTLPIRSPRRQGIRHFEKAREIMDCPWRDSTPSSSSRLTINAASFFGNDPAALNRVYGL